VATELGAQGRYDCGLVSRSLRKEETLDGLILTVAGHLSNNLACGDFLDEIQGSRVYSSYCERRGGV